jgi:hypothetical protein
MPSHALPYHFLHRENIHQGSHTLRRHGSRSATLVNINVDKENQVNGLRDESRDLQCD